MRPGVFCVLTSGRLDSLRTKVLTWPLPWLCDHTDRRPGFYALRLFIAGYAIVVLGSISSIALYHGRPVIEVFYLLFVGFYAFLGLIALPSMRSAALITEQDPTAIRLRDLMILGRLITWRKFDFCFLPFMALLQIMVPTLWTGFFLVGWGVRWLALHWGTAFYPPTTRAKAPAVAVTPAT